ncbi:S-adenosyl-L-methionine-dependent methyltransferase [Sphaerosporella brunnea]|uniref:S-adenosyl-L-methionine-dependent methyltransferase n=1 Tax=Sphaerosporella brunnea TaxID=1250544 RepID=A0A5J5F4T4_9PEZI|nr:S-adenosyl-L-methionine-dependent methyltransferase [Sphaerosporella brunnea]
MCNSDGIEIDPSVLDNADDSDYLSSGYDTSTASLTSSIHEYVFENGRRYHAYFGADKNLLPTDEIEQDRLDMYHEICLGLLHGDLYKAPIAEHPQRILDIGTGTGIWAIDMADRFPSAEVIGTDLTPIQPAWVPPNCRFEVDDAEKAWTFKPESFDFVHARNIAQGISDWPSLMRQVFRSTKPGGYCELVETGTTCHSDDGTMTETNGVKVWMETIAAALVEIGRPPASAEAMKKHLLDAGFVDVEVKTVREPLGPWPKDRKLKNIGAMVLMNCQTGFHAYGLAAFTRILGMTKEEADRICDNAYNAVRNKNYHCWCPIYVAYGRKPALLEK